VRRPLLDQPRLTANGAVVGRPRKLAPADAAKRIEKLAKRGFQKSDVATALGVDPKTLRAWFEEDERLQIAFDKGKGHERDKLHRNLVRKAMKGDTIANLFLLKTCHGYRENSPPEAGNVTNVLINIPGPRPMSDFIETPDADGTKPHRLSATRT
jgi:hypothetical protein